VLCMGVSIRSNNIGEEHYTRTILDDHRRRVRHVLVDQKPTRNGGEGVRLPMISNGIVFNDCETYCVADDEHRYSKLAFHGPVNRSGARPRVGQK
jgi:hypothetical protein